MVCVHIRSGRGQVVSGVSLHNIRYCRHYVYYAKSVINIVVAGNHVQTCRDPISGAAVRPGSWARRPCCREDGRVPVARKYESRFVRFVVRSKFE
jgi:hypothetical protein